MLKGYAGLFTLDLPASILDNKIHAKIGISCMLIGFTVKINPFGYTSILSFNNSKFISLFAKIQSLFAVSFTVG